MQKLLLILVVGLVLVMFAWSNTHHVEVGLVLGRPVHVRLIFLLLTTFLAGHFTAVVLGAYVRTRIKAKVRRQKAREDGHDEDESDFFSD